MQQTTKGQKNGIVNSWVLSPTLMWQAIIDSSYAPEGYSTKPSGAIAHWHVDDLKTTLDRLIAMGATEYQPITDHSQGKGTFVTASVADPFGNILGIMTNIHYLDILKQRNS